MRIMVTYADLRQSLENDFAQYNQPTYCVSQRNNHGANLLEKNKTA